MQKYSFDRDPPQWKLRDTPPVENEAQAQAEQARQTPPVEIRSFTPPVEKGVKNLVDPTSGKVLGLDSPAGNW